MTTPSAQAAPSTSGDSETPAPPALTERDLQRGQLCDLVALTTSCAGADAEIQSTTAAAHIAEERRYQQAAAEIESLRDRRLAEIEQIAQEAVASADQQFELDSKALQVEESSTRHRLDQERAAYDRQLRQELEKAEWLADSVCEAEHIKIAEIYRTTKGTIAASAAVLEDLERRASQMMVDYGHAPLPLPAAAPPVESADDAVGESGRGVEVVQVESDFAIEDLTKPAAVVETAVSADVATAVPVSQVVAAARVIAEQQTIEQRLDALAGLRSPRWVVGSQPFLIGGFLIILAGIAAQAASRSTEPQWLAIGISAGVALAISIAGGMTLAATARRSIDANYRPLHAALIAAQTALAAQKAAAVRDRQAAIARAEANRLTEIRQVREKLMPEATHAVRRRDSARQSADAEFPRRAAMLEQQREAARLVAAQSRDEALTQLESSAQSQRQAAAAAHAAAIEAIGRRRVEQRARLEERWAQGLSRIQSTRPGESGDAAEWDARQWANWSPARSFAATVRFGEMQVDLARLVEETLRRAVAQASVGDAAGLPASSAPASAFTLPLPPRFVVPALLAFPRQASLMIHSDRAGRGEAIRTLQMLMARLITSLPAGRVRFTIIDPVGLGQNFAGFMHLADYDESLVGTRIWTDDEHIHRRLADLTEHMETVIQKYLRNEFETIDDYNAQAGELAEPYRFLVIADLPVNFSDESMRRLASIAGTGWRCGVYTLIARDVRAQLPPGAHLDDIQANSVNLVRDGDRFAWKDEVFRRFPLTLDTPPAEAVLNGILHKVGAAARESNRVEVPFETIAPAADRFWSVDSASDLHVPIGRSGATRLQTFRLGRGVAQHALVAGKTGSGKSTLLNALITNLAMWYSPDQVELYLIDFKKGVEFMTYATHALPHARAIAVESDREFGLSVLQRLDAELTRRGGLFRNAAVQDLAAFRVSTAGGAMPRSLLIIDEFQEFFSEDDRVAQEAAVLLDRLVRQGRAFGIHVLLGSQTIAGSSGLARSTLGQMAVRIALQCSEADSQMILGDDNSAARLLSRPGEAIYNDAGGLVEGNSPFQIAWLPDEQREVFLDSVSRRAKDWHDHREPAAVFAGNAPAAIGENRLLRQLLDAPSWPAGSSAVPRAWLGDPVAIREPTAVSLRRQSGANVLMIGQQEDAAASVFIAMMTSLAAQVRPDQAVFCLLDGSPADSEAAATFRAAKAALPHEMLLVDYRGVETNLKELVVELDRRNTGDAAAVAPPVFLFIYGMQRYRMLRRQEDSFSFTPGEDEKAARADRDFARLVREGPAVGIHVIAWADTMVSVDRTFDRATLREFDHRVLFQMSSADSSNLIDSPAANKLGFHRALIYSEEQGVMEKFRPYGPLSAMGAWLNRVRESLRSDGRNS